MRVGRVHVAEEIIEAFFLRIIGGQRHAKAVFPDARGQVTRILEQPGHVEIRVGQVTGAIGANAAVARVQAGHEDATRGRADRGARIVPRELHALARQPVHVRGL